MAVSVYAPGQSDVGTLIAMQNKLIKAVCLALLWSNYRLRCDMGVV
jgi:hypothetical protein